MITHHKWISTHPVTCDSCDSAFILLQNFVKVVEEWGRRESGDLIQFRLAWNKQLIASEKAGFSILLSHSYPPCSQPLGNSWDIQMPFCVDVSLSFGPLSECCIDGQHSESALRMCARESDAVLMLPLSSLPSSHLLTLSFTKVSLWGVSNSCGACAPASLGQPVVQTVTRWIWGLSGSWLRQSLHTQATTSSRHDWYSW